uniref:Uncharacterized protein n=1 Tax=Romanomermis culicivorax TaxID=13658 RepID=A0A915KW89_ROMCU
MINDTGAIWIILIMKPIYEDITLDQDDIPMEILDDITSDEDKDIYVLCKMLVVSKLKRKMYLKQMMRTMQEKILQQMELKD